jgi:hypothetical protein
MPTAAAVAADVDLNSPSPDKRETNQHKRVRRCLLKTRTRMFAVVMTMQMSKTVKMLPGNEVPA